MRLSLPSLLFALCLTGACTPSPQGGGPISDFPAEGQDAGEGPETPDPGDSSGGDGDGDDGDGDPAPEMDAGPPPEESDAGSDAGDAGFDGGVDGGTDAGSDAGTDGGAQDAG